jgi:hypothetical protein
MQQQNDPNSQPNANQPSAQFASPPPLPVSASQIGIYSKLALALALIAFVLSLPILWTRMVDNSSTTMLGDVVTAVGAVMKQQETTPSWYKNLRAAAILSAFLGLVLTCLALIMKERGRQLGIAALLALASLLVTAPWLSFLAIGGAIALGILLVSLGAF